MQHKHAYTYLLDNVHYVYHRSLADQHINIYRSADTQSTAEPLAKIKKIELILYNYKYQHLSETCFKNTDKISIIKLNIKNT